MYLPGNTPSAPSVSDAGEEINPPPACTQHRCVWTTQVEVPLPSHGVACQSSSKGLDFLDRITQSINPEQQAQRDADRASTIFQAQQLLQSQIRDLNQTVLSLHTQLNDSERRHWGQGPLEMGGNMSGTLKGQEPFTCHVSTRHISGTCVMFLAHFPYI